MFFTIPMISINIIIILPKQKTRNCWCIPLSYPYNSFPKCLHSEFRIRFFLHLERKWQITDGLHRDLTTWSPAIYQIYWQLICVSETWLRPFVPIKLGPKVWVTMCSRPVELSHRNSTSRGLLPRSGRVIMKMCQDEEEDAVSGKNRGSGSTCNSRGCKLFRSRVKIISDFYCGDLPEP